MDLCSARYNNSPQVSYLGMNPGRGWNPELEESYLPEYSEYEAKNFKKCTLGINLHTVNILVPEHSPIFRYSESTKTTSFSILGFSSIKPQSSIAVAVALFQLHNEFFQGGSNTMLIFNGYIIS